jgi:hypothetical protein
VWSILLFYVWSKQDFLTAKISDHFDSNHFILLFLCEKIQVKVLFNYFKSGFRDQFRNMNGNNINETLFMLDDIRAGLQSLDDEEENLIILKSHLAKIKKIREDQIRKDELVSTLKDRINVLENELLISNRQSFELQEILSERIMTLENSLKDRNDLELSCYELTERMESLVVQKGLSDADLEFERNKYVFLLVVLFVRQHNFQQKSRPQSVARYKRPRNLVFENSVAIGSTGDRPDANVL